MSLMNLNIDNYIGIKIVDTDIFKNVHPNIITIFGIILNFVIFFLLKKSNILIANILTIIRCLCDILDGNIARKYNKYSKLGGTLDTICDFIFIQLYCFLIADKFIKNKNIVYTLCTINGLFNIYIMKDSISDHSIIENNNTLIGKIIEFFFKKNSFILYIGIIILNYYIF